MGRKLTVNIANYVKRLKNIDFFQPLYEAVVNSLDANAKHISIKFEVEIVKKGNKDLPLIKGFQVIDDGDGFNEKNT